MKRPAFLAASFLAGALLISPATRVDAQEASETFVTEEIVENTGEDAPAQTIDLSTFQDDDSTGLPGEPSPGLSDDELLQGDWPMPEETPVGPPKPGTADQLREAIRIRQIRTIAQRDPFIQSEKRRASRARTPEGRRTLMRNYYVLLYNRMVRLEPSLKDKLEVDLVLKLDRLEQKRIRPSILVEPYQPLPGSRVAEHSVVIETTTTTVTEEEVVTGGNE